MTLLPGGISIIQSNNAREHDEGESVAIKPIRPQATVLDADEARCATSRCFSTLYALAKKAK